MDTNPGGCRCEHHTGIVLSATYRLTIVLLPPAILLLPTGVKLGRMMMALMIVLCCLMKAQSLVDLNLASKLTS